MKVMMIPSRMTLADTLVTVAIVSLSICPNPQITTPVKATTPPSVSRSMG